MRRRSRPNATLHFFMNLTAGSYGPVDRLRRVANNLRRRSSGDGCCGNYGEPGC